MALSPIAGDRIYIGGVLADKSTDFIASDFSGQSWTEIDGWSQAGPLGDAAALISTPLINRGRDVKQKGTSNSGSMPNVFARNPSDAGQALLIARAVPTDKNNYAFRIVWNDGIVTYFIGLVMTAQHAGGQANTINNLNVTIEVNSNLVDA